MELELVDQWCTDYEIKLPLNLLDLYQSWHAQYEATLNAIDAGGNTQSGSNTGTNSGTQSGTVDDITPPSNNNSNSSGGNTGSASKPNGGSNSGNTQSNPSTGSSSNSGSDSTSKDQIREQLEAAGITEVDTEGAQQGNVGDGSGIELNEDALIPHGTQGTISW